MRVTIIRDDSLVGIDGQFRQVDLSGLPAGIRAVQWNGTGGHVEYDEAPNAVLDHITGFQPFIERWEAVAPRAASLSSGEAKTAALERIDAAYRAAVRALTRDYPEEEVRSWPKQEAEAYAWSVNPEAATPWIDRAAATRGISRAALAEKIRARAAVFTLLHAELTGKRQKLRDAIAALGERPAQKELDVVRW